MILLFLMGLGVANVNAQVRIGGNTPPNPAAALDLNAAEGTTTGTKGLALPRVTLSSNTATLDGATANITGMLVYNTGGSLSSGVYYWNGSAWNRVIGATSGAVDTTMLQAAPADRSMLVYYNGTWRTATYDIIYDRTISVPANGLRYDTIPTQSCVDFPNPAISNAAGAGSNPAMGIRWIAPASNVLQTYFPSNQPASWTVAAKCWRVH